MSVLISEFSNTFDLMLTEISYIVYELNLDGLSPIIGKAAVDISRSILKGYDMSNVVENLANIHSSWVRAINLNTEFITQDFIQILKSCGVPIDTNIISIVFICYEKIENNIIWTNISDDNRPVNRSDINKIWNHIYKLIIIVCKWIHTLRTPIRKRIDGVWEYNNAQFYGDIDINIYISMFTPTLI